jgi:UV DNA damage endonuclease
MNQREDRRQTPNRLGFAVKVLGRSGLKSNDARRWQSGPHLRVSLAYLDAILDYLRDTDIRMYRISSEIAPYITHPEMPQFHGQIEESDVELRSVGAKIRKMDLRVSMHPSQYIVLNSPDERVARAAIADFGYHARFLDALGTGSEAKIVTHVGGVYGDREAAMNRFVERYRALDPAIRTRLVLENDEVSYPVTDILAIHDACGVPLVFDILHHRVNNPAGLDDVDALLACLKTWPAGETPKIHYSTQRTYARTQGSADPAAPKGAKRGEHDDWIEAGDFAGLLDRAPEKRFDVMLEAKQKDLALLRLREELRGTAIDGRFW